MIRKIFLLSLISLFLQTGYAQNINMELLGQLSYSSDLSDIWGYVDGDGNEYALVGVDNPGGVSIVSLIDPANPIEVAFVADASSTWRDIKTWGDHAYATNESGQGLLIIDLSSLPDASGITSTRYTGPIGSTWTSAHNIYIDEFGIAYIFGANRGNGGAIFLDLSDPGNPLEIGTYDAAYIHDGMAQGNNLYSGHINNGFFSVVDVTDKANPVFLGSHETPSAFTHNIWVDDDATHVYTTDEVSGAYIGAYDISDLNDISETDRVQFDPGSETIVHNTHFLNEYVITSYYRAGVTVHDVSDPENMVLTGLYDTSPFSGNGFAGAWGAYPFLPSGLILVSDIEEGLFVIQPTYTRAARLAGKITESGTGNPIFNADVQLLNTSVIGNSDIAGDYKIGVALGATYSVIISKFGFNSDTIENVVLLNGETSMLDIQLDVAESITLNGLVADNNGGEVSGADVRFITELGGFSAVADENGGFSISNFLTGTYSSIAGRWGWNMDCSDELDISDLNPSITIVLNKGIQDDFEFDNGWTVQGSASTGSWERVIPVETEFGFAISNPGTDLESDCGNMAFITGNGGGGAGNDDVDGADTWLISPVFDATEYVNPRVSFNYWFFNAGGNSAPNDSLSVYIRDGNGTWTFVTDFENNAQWVQSEFLIEDFVTPGNEIQVAFKTSDFSAFGSHIVEAGIDHFEVLSDGLVGINKLSLENDYLIYPNPATNQISIELGDKTTSHLIQVYISDLSGKRVFEQRVVNINNRLDIRPSLNNGLYILNLMWDDQSVSTNKIIILK